jgi:hypothetical protein
MSKKHTRRSELKRRRHRSEKRAKQRLKKVITEGQKSKAKSST